MRMEEDPTRILISIRIRRQEQAISTGNEKGRESNQNPYFN